MKKNNKINLFALLMLTSFIANAMQPAPQLSPSKQLLYTSSTPGTPGILQEVMNNPTSPITDSEKLVARAQQTKNPKSRKKLLTLMQHKLGKTKNKGLTPGHVARRHRISGEARELAENAMHYTYDPNSPTAHLAFFSPAINGNQYRQLFLDFVDLEGQYSPPVAIAHIINGDKNGGRHFVLEKNLLAEFDGAIEQNLTTGVAYGKEFGTPRSKTAVVLNEPAIDPAMILQQINDVSQNPRAITPTKMSLRKFGITSQNVPLEVAFGKGVRPTAYPVFSFIQWLPGQPTYTVAPIIINGVDNSIVMSSYDALTLINEALNNNRDAVKYTNLKTGTVIFDLAQPLNMHGLTRIDRGIYVETPFSMLPAITLNTLQTNFPEYFQP